MNGTRILLYLLLSASIITIMLYLHTDIDIFTRLNDSFPLTREQETSDQARANSNYWKLHNNDPAFNLTLNPDKKIVLLVTSFRGGSTFLGQIFDSNPKMQYLYEPFHEGQMRNLFRRGLIVGARPDHSLTDLRMLYLQQILHNCTMYKTLIVKEKYSYCGTKEEHLHRFGTVECDLKARNPSEAHYEICKYRRTTVLKVIRLNDLSDIMKIANIRSVNVKIVHLLRNPLPMMKSRRTGWNYFLWDSMKMLEFKGVSVRENKIRQSYESYEYCTNNLKSVKFAESDDWVKDRYLRISHAELSLDPQKTAEKIYNFIEERLTDELRSYIANITGGGAPKVKLDSGGAKKRNPLEVRKNSSELVNLWQDLDWYLKYFDLFNIEGQCRRMMKLLGESFSVDSMSTVKWERLVII